MASVGNVRHGPQFKHTFWWREGDVDYAEAQFVAAISKDHPVLSLGVSIEKGLEVAGAGANEAMNRRVWDWPRLVDNLRDALATDVPKIAAALGAPIQVRVRRGARWEGDRRWWQTRAFSFVDGRWFERNAGRVRVEVETIVDHVREVDGRKDLWAIATITRDLGPAEAEGMTPDEVAGILLRFSGTRKRFRGGARTQAV